MVHAQELQKLIQKAMLCFAMQCSFAIVVVFANVVSLVEMAALPFLWCLLFWCVFPRGCVLLFCCSAAWQCVAISFANCWRDAILMHNVVICRPHAAHAMPSRSRRWRRK